MTDEEKRACYLRSGLMLLEDGSVWATLGAVAEALDCLPPSVSGRVRARLHACFAAYQHLVAHPAGTEAAVRSLRMLRRAHRQLEAGEVKP